MNEDDLAKIYGVALKYGKGEITQFPNIVPISTGQYTFTSETSWTAAFFPALLWQWYSKSLKGGVRVPSCELLDLARRWSTKLAADQNKDSHDIGFLINNSFGQDYELSGSQEALRILVNGAKNLYGRFSPSTGLIRSWNRQGIYQDPERTFLVIIDNMMNLELLFHASHVSANPEFIDAAVSHAKKTMENQVRDDGSHYHLVVYDTKTGTVLEKTTWQGYSDSSTWARGQAWGIYGFAAAYYWTRSREFLDTSTIMADYFLNHLPRDGIPAWDFDAPDWSRKDTSAATIAASGLLYLCSTCPGLSHKYFRAAEKLIEDTSNYGRSEAASYSKEGKLEVYDIGFESILKHATPNLGDKPREKISDVGVVYADYYLVEALRRLEDLGPISR